MKWRKLTTEEKLWQKVWKIWPEAMEYEEYPRMAVFPTPQQDIKTDEPRPSGRVYH